MSQFPAFNVRSYPSFRPARMFRVLLSDEAIYLIRMKGLIGHADAGGDYFQSVEQAMVSDLIRHWAGHSLSKNIEEVDRADPEELVRKNKKNLCLTPGDFVHSSLEPAALFGGHGAHYARWKFALLDGRKMVLQVETVDDLKVALDALPEFLGPTHTNKIGWDPARGRVVSVS